MEAQEQEGNWSVYTTQMFCNIVSLNDQDVGFFFDRRDEKVEFDNLHEVFVGRPILPKNLHGLNVISKANQSIQQFCLASNEPIIDALPEESKGKARKLFKEVKIAYPRTGEAKNFLGNIKEILHMRYSENRKPKEIGGLFSINPDKLHSFISHYILNQEDKFEKG